MSDEHRALDGILRRHLPEPAYRHFDRTGAIATRAAAGNPLFVVESYDRDYQPLQANIAADGEDAVMVSVRYEDGRWHKERWSEGQGEIADGHDNRPKLWGAGFGELP